MQKKVTKSKLNYNKTGTISKIIDDDYIFCLVKSLIMKHFRALSEEIADNLWSIETLYSTFEDIIQEQYKLQETGMLIKNHMDMLADDLDIILDAHKSRIITECQNVINKVSKDN